MRDRSVCILTDREWQNLPRCERSSTSSILKKLSPHVRWEAEEVTGGRQGDPRARALFGKREDPVVGERKRYMKAKLARTSPRNSLTWCALAIAQEVPVLRSLRVFPRIDIFRFSTFPKRKFPTVLKVSDKYARKRCRGHFCLGSCRVRSKSARLRQRGELPREDLREIRRGDRVNWCWSNHEQTVERYWRKLAGTVCNWWLNILVKYAFCESRTGSRVKEKKMFTRQKINQLYLYMICLLKFLVDLLYHVNYLIFLR